MDAGSLQFGASADSVVIMKTTEDGGVMETFEGDIQDHQALRSFISSFIDKVCSTSGVTSRLLYRCR